MYHQPIKSAKLYNNDKFHLNFLLGSSWKKKTSTFNYNITFTHTLVPLIEDAYKTAYTKG